MKRTEMAGGWYTYEGIDTALIVKCWAGYCLYILPNIWNITVHVTLEDAEVALVTWLLMNQ